MGNRNQLVEKVARAIHPECWYDHERFQRWVNRRVISSSEQDQRRQRALREAEGLVGMIEEFYIHSNDKRIQDLRESRDALSGALAHRLHETDPEMFFLAIRQILNSIRFLVDGYTPGSEDANRIGGEEK